MSVFWVVSLVPAGAGRPDCVLTRPLMLIGMNPNSVRTQPLAPGAANALSTNTESFSVTVPFGSSTWLWNGVPVIGLFGSGGLVVRVVNASLIGLDADPT